MCDPGKQRNEAWIDNNQDLYECGNLKKRQGIQYFRGLKRLRWI